jgi:hypothetical protein
VAAEDEYIVVLRNGIRRGFRKRLCGSSNRR